MKQSSDFGIIIRCLLPLEALPAILSPSNGCPGLISTTTTAEIT
jgi:hypothetical protein